MPLRARYIYTQIYILSGGERVVYVAETMMGVTTRSRKRKVGQRDVWDSIVKNDDISFKHILPRLNQTDLKFLYEVNSETRKLIKRSSRANKLELLKWAREEKKCEWDRRTITPAARQGNLEMVKFCVANECPIDAHACAFAASGGQLEVLKYLREEAEAPWDYDSANWAARNGRLHILEYLVERKYDEYEARACWEAAKSGHLDCLRYLHETAKAPWDYLAVEEACKNYHIGCLEYLLDNKCPLPPGFGLRWVEDGELHTP